LFLHFGPLVGIKLDSLLLREKGIHYGTTT
jgi:hypothetical protein